MKRKIIGLITICLVIVLATLAVIRIKEEENSGLKRITVAEVAHSVFYAPQYLADSLGYFKDEGLDVDINLTAGADAVMSAVLSDDVDIGFCGTEATIYVVDIKRKELFHQ